MGKIRICDVCYGSDKKLEKATYVIKTGQSYQLLKIDVCNQHKNFFKDIEYEDAVKKVNILFQVV